MTLGKHIADMIDAGDDGCSLADIKRITSLTGIINTAYPYVVGSESHNKFYIGQLQATFQESTETISLSERQIETMMRKFRTDFLRSPRNSDLAFCNLLEFIADSATGLTEEDKKRAVDTASHMRAKSSHIIPPGRDYLCIGQGDEPANQGRDWLDLVVTGHGERAR